MSDSFKFAAVFFTKVPLMEIFALATGNLVDFNKGFFFTKKFNSPPKFFVSIHYFFKGNNTKDEMFVSDQSGSISGTSKLQGECAGILEHHVSG